MLGSPLQCFLLELEELFFHSFANPRVFLGDVDLFLRVRSKVEEQPANPSLGVLQDQLVLVLHQTILCGSSAGMDLGQRRLPIKVPAAHERGQALSRDILHGREARQVEERGQDVDRSNHRFDAPKSDARGPDDQWDAHQFSEERVSVAPAAMIEEFLAVIGEQNDDRVVAESGFLERVENAAHVHVGKTDFAVVKVSSDRVVVTLTRRNEGVGDASVLHVAIVGIEVVQPQKPGIGVFGRRLLFEKADALVGDDLRGDPILRVDRRIGEGVVEVHETLLQAVTGRDEDVAGDTRRVVAGGEQELCQGREGLGQTRP